MIEIKEIGYDELAQAFPVVHQLGLVSKVFVFGFGTGLLKASIIKRDPRVTLAGFCNRALKLGCNKKMQLLISHMDSGIIPLVSVKNQA